jgi:hypothetical protein
MNSFARIGLLALAALSVGNAQIVTPVPLDKRGRADAERAGTHDANNIRTVFYNYGMVGDYPPDPVNVDLSVFHSVEVPKGTGMNYSDGITPFVLAQITQRDGSQSYIMETGYRERQQMSPAHFRVMRFEPRPGYQQANASINLGRSPAMSNDTRTWPDEWPDKILNADDPGWKGSWNGYFGKRPAADQESFTVMDDDFYDAWDFYPDSRDSTRRGLGLRVEVRGFQWANPQAGNVIFWHYDITNESTTNYMDNIIFGLYNDAGVGGSAISCDGIAESDDDNAYFDRSLGLNLVYTWDRYGHGVDLSGICSKTGYLGYAYLETPGNSTDGIDNDDDGITDENRDDDPGTLIVGQAEILAYVRAHYDTTKFVLTYGPIEKRPAFKAGRWWTGDEDMDWTAELDDTGADGIFDTHDAGEGDGKPTQGEPNYGETDLHESDQIGLTGFKMNRIKQGLGNPNPEVDDIVFYDNGKAWPERLYQKFTDPYFPARFDSAVFLNYNIGFFFASGTFRLPAGKSERFSLALAYGSTLDELRRTVKTVQQIYTANYQFAVPPPLPTLKAETGDKYVKLTWGDVSERGIDPVTGENDFEGYRIYRSTDPDFRDVRVITNGQGTDFMGIGKPLAQFDLKNGIQGFSKQVINGVAYYLGDDNGIQYTFIDTTVTNGQLYYYAVTSYDRGSDTLDFYPSENAITISRTPRGGTILPKNAVSVRPEPKVFGYIPAEVSTATHTQGKGSGIVAIHVVNSDQVPDSLNGKTLWIRFKNTSKDSIHAASYELVDSASGTIFFDKGKDFTGAGNGPNGIGVQPVITTLQYPIVDTATSKFTATSVTNIRLKAEYLEPPSPNARRVGYPSNITIQFSDAPLDTSLGNVLNPGKPTKVKVIAHTDSGDVKLKYRFTDKNADATLSGLDEQLDVVTTVSGYATPMSTWRITIDTTGQWMRGATVAPTAGDVFALNVLTPFTEGDIYSFSATAQRVDPAKAKNEFSQKPYVVPNPYVGSASFEPERYAVSGRGERRMEFRNLPARCSVRIYTVKGELVQTLVQDGSNNGFIAWNLRTKDNLEVAPGLYLYHVDGGSAGTHIGKFAIIK